MVKASGEYVMSPSTSSQYKRPYRALFPFTWPANAGAARGPDMLPCQCACPEITSGGASAPRRRLMKSSQVVRSWVSKEAFRSELSELRLPLNCRRLEGVVSTPDWSETLLAAML